MENLLDLVADGRQCHCCCSALGYLTSVGESLLLSSGRTLLSVFPELNVAVLNFDGENAATE